MGDVLDFVNENIIDPIVGPVQDVFKGITGETAGEAAAEAALQGSATQAQAQRESLEYLKEREAIPQQFREEALTGLGGIYGLEGGTGDQQALIDRAIQSPLYQAIMGGQQAGEESIMRSASATGGLRSGNVQGAMYDYNTQLQNKALLQSYNEQLQGLTGLANLPSGAAQIAQGITGVGQTLGQGQVAAGQAQQTAQQQGINNLLGLGGLGLDAAGIFSDRRLKKNIIKIGDVNGHNWYKWVWNSVGEKLGMKGECMGCMADEIFKTHPENVIMKDNFMFVLYSKLGIFAEGRQNA